jgi:hypothetical protein
MAAILHNVHGGGARAVVHGNRYGCLQCPRQRGPAVARAGASASASERPHNARRRDAGYAAAIELRNQHVPVRQRSDADGHVERRCQLVQPFDGAGYRARPSPRGDDAGSQVHRADPVVAPVNDEQQPAVGVDQQALRNVQLRADRSPAVARKSSRPRSIDPRLHQPCRMGWAREGGSSACTISRPPLTAACTPTRGHVDQPHAVVQRRCEHAIRAPRGAAARTSKGSGICSHSTAGRRTGSQAGTVARNHVRDAGGRRDAHKNAPIVAAHRKVAVGQQQRLSGLTQVGAGGGDARVRSCAAPRPRVRGDHTRGEINTSHAPAQLLRDVQP